MSEDVIMTRVKFDNPPVVEVVCGVQFDTPSLLKAAHIGLYWQRIRENFPRLEEAEPIPPVLDSSEITPSESAIAIQMPRLPRTWFLSEDGRCLIQLQEDRFLYNWKRSAGDDCYPSYAIVIEQFYQYLAEFENFLATEAGLNLTPRQFELTYVNHIGPENGLAQGGAGSLLVDHRRDTTPERFLPDPEAFNWQTSYRLPHEAGRLHIRARTALRLSDRAPIVRLDLTARGLYGNLPESGMRSWFDLAHQWITHGFADASSPELQRTAWGRTE